MIFTHKQIIKKKWGYEKIITNDREYCGKILTVLPNGNTGSIHYHKQKIETFHMLKGKLELELYILDNKDNPSLKKCIIEKFILNIGDSITLHPYKGHRFWAIDEVAEFIEFSTQDSPEDSYRLLPSGFITVDAGGGNNLSSE